MNFKYQKNMQKYQIIIINKFFKQIKAVRVNNSFF